MDSDDDAQKSPTSSPKENEQDESSRQEKSPEPQLPDKVLKKPEGIAKKKMEKFGNIHVKEASPTKIRKESSDHKVDDYYEEEEGEGVDKIDNTSAGAEKPKKGRLNRRTRKKIAHIRAIWKERDSRASQARGTKLGSPSPAPKITLLHGAEPVSTRLEMWEDRVITDHRSSIVGSKTSIPHIKPSGLKAMPQESTIPSYARNIGSKKDTGKFKRASTAPFIKSQQAEFIKPATKERQATTFDKKIIRPQTVEPHATFVKSNLSKFGGSLPLNEAAQKISNPPFKVTETQLVLNNKVGGLLDIKEDVTKDPSTNIELKIVGYTHSVMPIKEVVGLKGVDSTLKTIPVAMIKESSVDKISKPLGVSDSKIESAVMIPKSVPSETKIRPGGISVAAKPVLSGFAFIPGMIRPGGMGKPLTIKEIKALKSETDINIAPVKSDIGELVSIKPIVSGLAFIPGMIRPGGMGKPLTIKEIKALKSGTDISIVPVKSDMIKDKIDSEPDSMFQLPPSIMASISDTSAAAIKKTFVPKVSTGITNVEKWGALGGAVAGIIKTKKGITDQEKPKDKIVYDAKPPVKKELQEGLKNDIKPTSPTKKEKDPLEIKRSPTPMTLQDFEDGDNLNIPRDSDVRGERRESDSATLEGEKRGSDESDASDDSLKINLDQLPTLELHTLLEHKSKPKPQNRKPATKKK